MEELVTIALKNDKGEWKSVEKTNTATNHDVFVNRITKEQITIHESATESPAELCEDFDVYAYHSENEYNEVELAYLTNEAMKTSIYSDKEPLVIYYGNVNNEKKPEVKGKVTILTTDGSYLQTIETADDLTELDIIDLGSFKFVEISSMKIKMAMEQTKKYSM